MISPLDATIPVLRPADSPRGPALASTRTPGTAVYTAVSRVSSAGLWSTTSRISAAGYDCARTEATAASVSSQRSTV